MLEPAAKNQTDFNVSNSTIFANDYELNGTINRAASEGAKFALILAMLDQDCTHRPQVESSEDIKHSSEAIKQLNYYRSSPLSANDTYWKNSEQTSQLIHTGNLHSAQLWLAMHPEPLSQYNKPDEIDEEVIANCSLLTQTRLKQVKSSVVKVNEAGLYDILQELETAS